MAAPRGSVSGLAVGMVGVGALMLWSAVRNVPVLDAVRSLARGVVPAARTQSFVLPTTQSVQGQSGFEPGAQAGQGAGGGGGGSW